MYFIDGDGQLGDRIIDEETGFDVGWDDFADSLIESGSGRDERSLGLAVSELCESYGDCCCDDGGSPGDLRIEHVSDCGGFYAVRECIRCNGIYPLSIHAVQWSVANQRFEAV